MRLIVPIIAMTVVVVASNILVQFLFGSYLTWGAFTYPFAFLVTDLVNRICGAADARRVVLWGFACGLICSAVGTQITGDFGPLVTWRILVASATAFLCAQMMDVAVFSRIQERSYACEWWQAPVISSLLGSTIDTVLFFFIAFSVSLTWIEPVNDVSWANEMVPLLGVGPDAALWLSLAAADWAVKLVLALLALMPFRMIVVSVRS